MYLVLNWIKYELIRQINKQYIHVFAWIKKINMWISDR